MSSKYGSEINFPGYRATGEVVFTADGFDTTVDFVHNLNIVGSPVFMFTALTPITTSHLARTVSYPNQNTIRLTFSVAPIIGENMTYKWIVF